MLSSYRRAARRMSASGILQLHSGQLKLAGLLNPKSLSQSPSHQSQASAGAAPALGLLEGTATAALSPAAHTLESAVSWTLPNLRATADHQQYRLTLVIQEGKDGGAKLILLGLSVVAG